MTKKTIADKEQELLKKIEKAKKELTKIQEKQKLFLGVLAYKHNLNQLDESIIEEEFKAIAIKHGLSNAA